MRNPEPSPSENKVRVKIISPQHLVLQAEVDKVLLPCINGDMMILTRHAPCFCTIKAGHLVLYDKNKKTTVIVSNGVAEVRRNICAVLAWGVLSDEIKRPDVEAQLSTTQKLLNTIHTRERQGMVLERIHFLQLLLAELSNQGK